MDVTLNALDTLELGDTIIYSFQRGNLLGLILRVTVYNEIIAAINVNQKPVHLRSIDDAIQYQDPLNNWHDVTI